MFDEVNRALEDYFGKWQALIDNRKDAHNKEFFERLKPTAVGWKAANFDEYKRILDEIRASADLINECWMNERWVATIHLRDAKLSGDIEIIELLQSRPSGEPKSGLDFVDFFCTEETNAKAVLAEENDINATHEENGNHQWTSIWFDAGEAKLKNYLGVDLVSLDAQAISNKIRGEKFAIAQNTSVAVTVPDVE